MANFYDLKHYIAHYINKGRCLVSEKGKTFAFSERVYDRRGNYSDHFNQFIDRMLESGEFFHLHVEGDRYAFSDLIHSRYDLEYSVQCSEPLSGPISGASGPSACYQRPQVEEPLEAQYK